MDPKKMLGFETEADKRVPIRAGDFLAMKLALWRSRVSWEIVMQRAQEILDTCEHLDGCPGASDDAKACIPDVHDAKCPSIADPSADCLPECKHGCRDREIRLSALVMLAAARQFAPLDAKKLADAPYFAPSREHYAAVLGELAQAQAELAAIRGAAVTVPPVKEETP